MAKNEKENLILKIKALASEIPNLESLTIVGSHGDFKKPLEKTNDFDLLFIFKKLTCEELNILKNKLDIFSKEAGSNTHFIWPEFRIGPVKAVCPKPVEFGTMLHVLVFDIKSFADYQKVAPFATFDWSRFDAIYGKNLKNDFKFSAPNKDQLLHAPRHSFDFYEKTLNEKAYILIDLLEDGDKIVPKTNLYPFSNEQLPEVFSDIIKKMVLDTVIVSKKMSKKWEDEELLDYFFEILPSLSNLRAQIEEIISLKKILRNGGKIEKPIGELEQITRNLFAEIKKAVEQSEI